MPNLVMGYWDCPFCGNKGNRGDVSNCPACGRARGDVQFYVKDYQEGQNLREEELGQFEQLDEEKAQSFSKNPDWYCSFCNSLNIRFSSTLIVRTQFREVTFRSPEVLLPFR